jgi:hypothetical protein
MYTQKMWPSWISTPRTQIDVGAMSISGKNTAGNPVTWQVPQMTNGTDDLGRKQDIWYQTILPNAGDYLAPNSSYTVSIAGNGGSVPATTFDVAAPSNNNAGLFLGNGITVNTPALNDNGPLVGGTDYTVHWTPSTASNLPANDAPMVAVWLVSTTGVAIEACMAPASQGQFTIPGATINEFKTVSTSIGADPTHALMLRNEIIGQVARLPDSAAAAPRRLDMTTINCWAQIVGVN